MSVIGFDNYEFTVVEFDHGSFFRENKKSYLRFL